MGSITLVQILARFILVLSIMSIATSSPRPNFGELNQEMNANEGTLEFLDLPVESEHDYVDYDDSNSLIPYGFDGVTLMKRLSKLKEPQNYRRNGGIKKKLKTKTDRELIRCFFNAVTCFGK